MQNEPVLSEFFWDSLIHPDEERLKESQKEWEKTYNRKFSLEDMAEIHRNLFGLLKLLEELERKYPKDAEKPANPA